jgi:hypothetical protein
MSIEDYNNGIVNNINSVVKDDEAAHFVFFGVITKGTFEQTKELFSKIAGLKSIIDYNYNQTQFTKDQWKEIGFTQVWTNSCAEEAIINGNKTYVIIEIEEGNLEKVLSLGYYVAIAESLVGMQDTYKDRLLNISIGNWGLYPIELEEELPRIFNDQELFLTMKEDTPEC